MDNKTIDNEHAFQTTKTESRRFTFSGKQLLIAAGVVAALIAAVFIWKTVQLNSLKKEHAGQQAALEQSAKATVLENSKRHLKLLAKPYTWAVRNALLQSNLAQVNEYANDIVKERGVVSVMVVDTKNKVLSSTNKKYEGKDYLTFGTAGYLSVDSATVHVLNDSLLVLASPVMSFTDKLGTIVFSYSVPPPAFLKPTQQ